MKLYRRNFMTSHHKTYALYRSKKVRSFVGLTTMVGLFIGIGLGMIGTSRDVRAIQPDGLLCDGNMYQSRNSGAGTFVYRIDRSVSPYTATALSATPLEGSTTNFHNGLAYDPLTGYLRIWRGGSRNFVTINNAGTAVSSVTLPGSGNLTMQGATMDNTGKYYSMIDGNNIFAYYVVDTTVIPTPTLTNVALTVLDPTVPRGSVGDMAIDPTNSNIIYVSTAVVSGDPTSQNLINKIDLSAGTYQVVGSVPSSFGSLFFDSAGTLYAYANSGSFYQVNKTTAAVTLLSSASTASVSDGASCGYEPASIDTIKSQTSVTATDTTHFQVIYRIGVKNTSGTGVAATNVQLTEALDKTFSSGSPTITLASTPTLVSGTCTINNAFNGTTNTRLISGSDTLADGNACTIDIVVNLAYATSGDVPTAAMNNTVYASSTSSGPNAGYTFNTSGDPTPPINLVSSDLSSNSVSYPVAAHGDTASPTPTTLPIAPLLRAYKTVKLTTDTNSNAAVDAGDTVTYTMIYRNDGNQDVTAFQTTDSVPAGTSYVAGSLTVTPSGAGQTGSANAGFNGTSTTTFLASPVNLVIGGTLTVQFAVTIDSGTSGTITNQTSSTGGNITATLSDAADTSASGDCAPVSGISVPTGSISQTCTSGIDSTSFTVATLLPVVTITKTDNATSVAPNGDLVYTITISNTAAGSTATNLVVKDTIPADTTYVSSSNGGTLAAGEVTWTIASLTGGTSVTRTITVNVNAGTIDGAAIANTATVSSSSDANLCSRSGSNCSATDDDTIVSNPAIVTITKDDGTATVAPNGSLTYTVTVSNTAVGSTATNLVIKDTLPAGATYVASSNSGSMTSGDVTWNIASLAGGTSITLTVTVTADSSTTDGTALINTVAVSSTDDANLCSRAGSDCTASDTTTFVNQPVITVTKSDNATTIAPNGSLTYDITISNTATNSLASAITLSDTLPANTTFVSATDGGTNSAGTVSWSIANLVGGTSVTRSVTVTVNNGTSDGTTLTNSATASVTGDSAACTLPGANCTGSDTTTVSTLATVTTAITDGQISTNPGSTLTYTVTASNTTSGSTVANTVVTATVPAGTTFVSATSGGTLSGNTITWNIGSLAGGSSVTPSFVVTVDSGTPDATVLTSTATVSSTSDASLCNRSGSSCSDSDTTTVSVVTPPQPSPLEAPSGYLTVAPTTGNVLSWNNTWINNNNTSPLLTKVVIPMPADTTYQQDSVQCTVTGTSTTSSCVYDSATNSVIWQGVLGTDTGAMDAAHAANELSIAFLATPQPGVTTFHTQGLAYWDQNADNVLGAADTNIATNQPVLSANATTINGTIQPTPITLPAAAPTLAKTGSDTVILMTTSLSLIMGAIFIRHRTQSTR